MLYKTLSNWFNVLFKPAEQQSAAKSLPAATQSVNAVVQLESHQLLHQLMNRRQLLEVVTADGQHSLQTLILAIDVKRGLIWLDDLFPGQYHLETGDTITLRHHRQGELLSLSSPIVAWGADYGATGLAILLPDEASYRPRRALPRLALERLSLTGKIRTLGEEPVYGQIQDLSQGGMSLFVAGNLLVQLRHGDILPLCEVRLAPGLQINCRARVCAFRLARSPYRGTRIHLEFVDLPDTKRAQLKVFLERLSQNLEEKAQSQAA
jgi:c-di-GMP-binding flagellar brake protein YcgR